MVKLLNYRSHRLDSYENSLTYYNLTSLSNRRKLIDMSFLFKMLNNLIDSPTLLSKINFVTGMRMPIRTSRNKNKTALNLKKITLKIASYLVQSPLTTNNFLTWIYSIITLYQENLFHKHATISNKLFI